MYFSYNFAIIVRKSIVRNQKSKRSLICEMNAQVKSANFLKSNSLGGSHS